MPAHPQTRIPCTLMRGGTSKGPFFLATDLPGDVQLRDRVLLAVMGSPDARQIDGLGGADPLTSKVAIVSRSSRPGIDVDYLFAQVSVDRPIVDVTPNCGNMLAGVGPFFIERGLVPARDPVTPVKIFMVNTESIAVAYVPTPAGEVSYEGDTSIAGVPGTAAAIRIDFLDTAGSVCGALLPTGHALDQLHGIEATLIDNGMPVVVLRAADFGKSGHETPAELDAAGRSGAPLMGLLGWVFGNPIDVSHWNESSVFVLAKKNAAQLHNVTIYFNCGQNDNYGFETGAAALHTELQKESVKHEYHPYPGDHSPAYFLAHFEEVMELHSKAFGLANTRP